MLVRCPKCREEFRLVDYSAEDKVVKYLCPGCDTIVHIDLEQDEVASSSSSGSYRSIDRKKTVLVADDSGSVLEMAHRLLSEAGYNVVLAHDGLEALRMVRDKHPDLVVLDLLMPRMTGFDVLREIRRDERIMDTAVLAISGVYKENILEFLHRLGAKGFIDKAQLRETLVFRVHGLLDSSAANA